MFEKTQGHLIDLLWNDFIQDIPRFSSIFQTKLPSLDHLALIDLSSEYCGISYLKSILTKIGFQQRGHGYLSDKANDFVWLAEPGIEARPADKILPQIVLADFRIDQLSKKNRDIVAKYATEAKPINFSQLDELLSDKSMIGQQKTAEFIFNHITDRPWSLPTLSDFNSVNEENQLVAWVLALGRKVNHFGLNINLLNQYSSLAEFTRKLKLDHGLSINNQNGEIKGSKAVMLEQASNIGQEITLPIQDGEIKLQDSFLEFVWRYSNKQQPSKFGDYYMDFIPHHADNIIESLYNTEDKVA